VSTVVASLKLKEGERERERSKGQTPFQYIIQHSTFLPTLEKYSNWNQVT
jgi:hypothetical protein